MVVTGPAGRDQKLKMLIHLTLESHDMFSQIIKHIFSTLTMKHQMRRHITLRLSVSSGIFLFHRIIIIYDKKQTLTGPLK